MELDQQEPAISFSFVPPSDAKQIAQFPNAFGKQFDVQDLTGKPAPDLSLKTSEGKIATLSSFRGHPVFIEFWATWCGPCVDLMPHLGELYAEIKGKDLAWMSIDNDEDSTSAAEFLADQHIPWPNYHDEDGSLGKAFHREGIPLGVLIDADGKVVFHQSGYEISDLRAAIAKLGPQFSSVASRDAKVQSESVMEVENVAVRIAGGAMIRAAVRSSITKSQNHPILSRSFSFSTIIGPNCETLPAPSVRIMSPSSATAAAELTASANELTYSALRPPFSRIVRANASPLMPSMGFSLAA